MTKEQPTPETDAVAMQPVDRLARAYTFHGTEPFNYSTDELVSAEFARRLERERDEWYYKAHSNFNFTLEARTERDQARKEAEYYKERYEQLKDQCGRLGFEVPESLIDLSN